MTKHFPNYTKNNKNVQKAKAQKEMSEVIARVIEFSSSDIRRSYRSGVREAGSLKEIPSGIEVEKYTEGRIRIFHERIFENIKKNHYRLNDTIFVSALIDSISGLIDNIYNENITIAYNYGLSRKNEPEKLVSFGFSDMDLYLSEKYDDVALHEG